MAMSCALNVFAFREGERGSKREKIAVSVIFEAYLEAHLRGAFYRGEEC